MVEWITTPANLMAMAQLIAAVVTALATIALWYVTRTLAIETKVLSTMTSQPFVVFSFKSSLAAAEALDCVITNTGNATAFDIVVTLDPALPHADGSSKNDQPKTTYDVSLLPPNTALPREGVMSRDVYKKSYGVEVSWAKSPRSTSRETVQYNIRPEDGFKGGWGVKGDHQIAQELEKIRKAIGK